MPPSADSTAPATTRAKASASLPMGKLGQVGEIAEFVVFLLSDRSGVVTGSVIDWDQNVLGGMDYAARTARLVTLFLPLTPGEDRYRDVSPGAVLSVVPSAPPRQP